jgi:nucleoside-diphosphate-sugar epimerase
MTIAFVTGATGFLGRHLCTALRAGGVTVHEHGQETGDIRDAKALRRAVDSVNPDWVFHLAADIRQNTPLADLLETNVVGTMNLLNAAQGRPLVAVGSFEEYGDCPVPFREDMPPRPRSPYGISKAIASLLVTASRGVVIRLPVLYGPGQSANMFIGGACDAVRTGKRLAMTPGQQTRDFLYVADAIDALMLAVKQFATCRGEILNACSGIALTLREAVQTIGGNFADIGAKPYRANEQMHYVGDCAKIARVLGWKAQTSFAEGIRRTLASDAQQ